jgi:hypothetical protein
LLFSPLPALRRGWCTFDALPVLDAAAGVFQPTAVEALFLLYRRGGNATRAAWATSWTSWCPLSGVSGRCGLDKIGYPPWNASCWIGSAAMRPRLFLPRRLHLPFCKAAAPVKLRQRTPGQSGAEGMLHQSQDPHKTTGVLPWRQFCTPNFHAVSIITAPRDC